MQENVKDFTSVLGICIPVYNKKDFVVENLEKMHRIFEQKKIVPLPIYISDNCSTDGFKDLLPDLQIKYPNLVVHENETNLGVDRNFEYVLKMCDQKYAWLLGADDEMSDDILDLLEWLENHQYDFVITDGRHNEGMYDDANTVITDLAYEPCWISRDIFLREVIDKLDFKKFYDSYWIQVGIILDYVSKNKFTLYLMNKPYAFQMKNNKISWGDGIANIYLKLWMDMIFSLDGYTKEQKEKCLEEGHRNRIMDNSWLLSLRAKGVYTSHFLKTNYHYLKYYNKSSYLVLFLISILPKSLMRLMRILYIKITNVRTNS